MKKKKFYLTTILLMIAMLLCSCDVNNDDVTPSGAVSGNASQEVTTEPTAQTTAVQTAEATITPTTVPTEAQQTTAPEPTYIKTEGGAVLVGKVGRNSSGEYCLILDSAVTVELNYFIDHPEMFEDMTEILLYDSDIDGINKSEYEDKEVTIKGVLENPRSAGRLYVYVVDIEEGRTTDGCYADESITRGEE